MHQLIICEVKFVCSREMHYSPLTTLMDLDDRPRGLAIAALSLSSVYAVTVNGVSARDSRAIASAIRPSRNGPHLVVL